MCGLLQQVAVPFSTVALLCLGGGKREEMEHLPFRARCIAFPVKPLMCLDNWGQPVQARGGDQRAKCELQQSWGFCFSLWAFQSVSSHRAALLGGCGVQNGKLRLCQNSCPIVFPRAVNVRCTFSPGQVTSPNSLSPNVEPFVSIDL